MIYNPYFKDLRPAFFNGFGAKQRGVQAKMYDNARKLMEGHEVSEMFQKKHSQVAIEN